MRFGQPERLGRGLEFDDEVSRRCCIRGNATVANAMATVAFQNAAPPPSA